MQTLSLDILIPTYNRSDTLRECLEAILKAESPGDLSWRVTVVDNNSRDNTRGVVESLSSQFSGKLRYLFEPQPGKSHALNLGITASDRTLIGMLDDDELIDERWITIVRDSFVDPALDYIGGPYYGLWRTAKPNWLPPSYPAVLSADDAALVPPHARSFDDENMFLRGGNAVVRREVFDRIGLYTHGLGKCEDHDMFTRLRAAGARGVFIPDLVIHHIVPADRATRAYHRKWVWSRGLSLALMDRQTPENVVYVGRIPRYMIGRTVRCTPQLVFGSAAERFDAELEWRNMLGFIYGAYR